MGITSPQRGQRGFTLIELLVVLALLAMIAGLAVPRLSGVLRKSRMRQAARQIAEDLTNARVLAVIHGLTYELRVASDNINYTIRPKYSPDPNSLESDSLTGVGRDGIHDASDSASRLSATPLSRSSQFGQIHFNGGSSSILSDFTRPRERPESIEKQLDDGVVFGDEEQLNESFEGPFRLPTAKQSVADPSIGSPDTSWKPLATFYPDGRSETTNITLSGDNGRSIRLLIRGLTGAVRILPMNRDDAPFTTAMDLPSEANNAR